MVFRYPIGAAICLPLIFISYWRFVERRFKSTERTYEYIITIFNLVDLGEKRNVDD